MPMKPMVPPWITAPAVSTPAAITIATRQRDSSRPRLAAVVSPVASTSSGRAMSAAAAVANNAPPVIVHGCAAQPRSPASQNIMPRS
jgi:hypothetical protein